MGTPRRQYGFWAAVGSLRLSDLVAPEFAWGLVLGGTGAWYLASRHTVDDRIAFAGDFLFITPALLGVVFAGFALVIAFMSDSYIRLMQTTSNGVFAFLKPFMITTGFQVGAILGAVWYRAVATDLVASVEPWLFGAVSVLFVISVLDIVALARSVLMHGLARARALEIDDISQQRDRRRDAGAGR